MDIIAVTLIVRVGVGVGDARIVAGVYRRVVLGLQSTEHGHGLFPAE